MTVAFHSLYGHDFVRIGSCVPRTRAAAVKANLSETISSPNRSKRGRSIWRPGEWLFLLWCSYSLCRCHRDCVWCSSRPARVSSYTASEIGEARRRLPHIAAEIVRFGVVRHEDEGTKLKPGFTVLLFARVLLTQRDSVSSNALQIVSG
jgi:hypothetical protein